MKFQYILCYFLSVWSFVQEKFQQLFQYILCYFLSENDFLVDGNGYSFQYILCYFLSILFQVVILAIFYFNTSYVIFYHKLSYWIRGVLSISIHPMLFFIARLNDGFSEDEHFNTSYVIFYRINVLLWDRDYLFQYILCYFLSMKQSKKQHRNMYFNTSYVIFYPNTLRLSWIKEQFQYILCYFLS